MGEKIDVDFLDSTDGAASSRFDSVRKGVSEISSRKIGTGQWLYHKRCEEL